MAKPLTVEELGCPQGEAEEGAHRAPAGMRYEAMDPAVPGFGVRVTDKGKRTYVLVGRFPGSKHPTRREIAGVGKLT